MNRQHLEKPFPANIIKSRKGSYGDELFYIEAVEYIRRLNDAFEGEWEWQIEDYEIREKEIVVHGVLRAGGVAKHAFGGAAITVNRNGDIVSVADNLKAAATDALKKACSLFGVGLELYGVADAHDRNGNGASNRGGRNPRTSPGPALVAQDEHKRSGHSNVGAPVGLTQKQLRALYAIARGRGMNADALRTLCLERYGVPPESLSRADASAFIEQLSL